MDISSYLMNYLNSQERYGYNNFMELCENILDRKRIEGLNGYPMELIAIELEKMIMMCIEQNKIKYHFPSYFKSLKLKEPMIYKNAETLKNYIRLFIRDRKSINTNKDLEPIENFYNNIIEKYNKMPINRVITLPGGSKTNMNEMISVIGDLLNNQNLQNPSLFVKKTGKKAKKAVAIGTLLGTITTSLIVHGYANPSPEHNKSGRVPQEEIMVETEANVELPNEVVSTDIEEDEEEFVLPSAGVFSPDVFIENYEEFTTDYINNATKVIEENKNLPQFSGYQIDVEDSEKNNELYEKQKFLYELCQKEGVDFNNAMTIWHIESDGHFNCNGKENSTHDYGEMQINECNLKSLNEVFQFVEGKNPSMDAIKDVFKNDWQKNMIASVYLIKGIENMYEKGDYVDVFGCYNGWINWKSKSISLNYSKKASELRQSLYNKSPEELFTPTNVYDESMMEVSNGRSI